MQKCSKENLCIKEIAIFAVKEQPKAVSLEENIKLRVILLITNGNKNLVSNTFLRFFCKKQVECSLFLDIEECLRLVIANLFPELDLKCY